MLSRDWEINLALAALLPGFVLVGPPAGSAFGYALANAGHDTRAIQAWMGHKNIQHTVRYTELAPDRFKDFWRD